MFSKYVCGLVPELLEEVCLAIFWTEEAVSRDNLLSPLVDIPHCKIEHERLLCISWDVRDVGDNSVLPHKVPQIDFVQIVWSLVVHLSYRVAVDIGRFWVLGGYLLDDRLFLELPESRFGKVGVDENHLSSSLNRMVPEHVRDSLWDAERAEGEVSVNIISEIQSRCQGRL